MTDEQTPEANGERAVATVEERLAALEERANRPRKRRPPVPPPPPPPAPAPRRTCLATCALFAGLSLLVLTIVVAVMMILTTVQITGFLRDPVDNFLEVFGFERGAEPQEVDSRTIVLGIHELALLQTASGDIQIQKSVVDTGAAPDAELTVNYIGRVTAGIDLQQVTAEDVALDEAGTVTVSLPPAQLTGCSLGKPEIVHRRCTGIPLAQDCGAILQRLQEVAYDRALEELVQTAQEMKLVDLADREAQARIYDLLTSLGHQRVAFRVTGEAPPVPDTCVAP